MDTNKILHTDYLDILFDGRNKAYGSYELRREYARRTRRAGMIVLLAMVLTGGGFYVANALKPPTAPPLAMSREVIIAPPPVIDPPPPPPDPPIAPPPPPPPPAPTVDFRAPVIIEDQDVQEDEKPAEVKDLVNAQPGDADLEGDPNNHDIHPLDTRPPGTGFISPPAENTVREYVEQMPEFPGNVSEYLGKNIVYPQQARQNGIEGRVVVRFVITEDGSVSDVQVLRSQGGGLDQEAVRVVKGMPKWKPGKQQGKAVKVYYTLPISFRLQ